MVRIIFIPSYGTDSSLYENLQSTKIVEAESIFTEWIPTSKEEDLPGYAQRFIDTYEILSSDILVGVSLGGVLAIEINKIMRVRKIITISSIKTKDEKPALFVILEKTKAYKLFSPGVLKLGLDLILPLYGRNVASYLWFRRVFKSFDNHFLKWALRQIVCWDNEEVPDNLIHIHGSRDPLFPIRRARNIDHKIKDGTHAMIRFRATEIAEIINRETR